MLDLRRNSVHLPFLIYARELFGDHTDLPQINRMWYRVEDAVMNSVKDILQDSLDEKD